MTQASYLAKEILEDLITIERTLWENNAEIYHDRYSPEALLIFPGVGRIDRDTARSGYSARECRRPRLGGGALR
jgi:hypothetical protein